MDDSYLDAFLEEGKEAITDLNNSLLALESDPDDEEAMDQVFRTAHTLKGNFAAMGFDDASDLAHAVEDLLDEMRDGTVEVTPDVMDLVFAGVDGIEAAIDQIEAEGEHTGDYDDLVAEIRAAIDDHAADADEDAGGESDSGGNAAGPPADFDPQAALSAIDDPAGATEDGAVFRVEATIDVDQLKGVDAMLALEAVEEDLDLLGTVPERDAIEDGEYDDAVALFVQAPEQSAVQDVAASTGKIAEATVAEVTDDLAAAVDEGTTDAGGAGDDAGNADAGGAADEAGSTDATPASSASGAGAGGASGPSSTGSSGEEISSVRVDVERLDELYGLVKQFVTHRVKLSRGVDDGDVDGVVSEVSELEKTTSNLQDTVMEMRLVPLERVIGKFPRLVRDLSRDQGKEIDFVVEGEDVELDRTILTEISDPLMHVLRNSVDHGIEPPEEREAAGKPRQGTIELRATRERDHVVIEVEDDGRGIDADAIRETAVEQGLRSREEVAAMEDQDVYDLVFHPGFSTADEVTDVSGRGVGMNVVHETVTQLDGSIDVDSEPGQGTTVALRLPVSMAIVKVLLLRVGDEEYAVPIKDVEEITAGTEIEVLDGKRVVEHDDDIYPLVELHDAFDVPDAKANGDGELVRIDPDERQIAIQCDEVKTQREVVVSPLEGILSGAAGLSGTAILGDGDIVHVIDVVTL